MVKKNLVIGGYKFRELDFSVQLPIFLLNIYVKVKPRFGTAFNNTSNFLRIYLFCVCPIRSPFGHTQIILVAHIHIFYGFLPIFEINIYYIISNYYLVYKIFYSLLINIIRRVKLRPKELLNHIQPIFYRYLIFRLF